jgi:hypothetical protein
MASCSILLVPTRTGVGQAAAYLAVAPVMLLVMNLVFSVLYWLGIPFGCFVNGVAWGVVGQYMDKWHRTEPKRFKLLRAAIVFWVGGLLAFWCFDLFFG